MPQQAGRWNHSTHYHRLILDAVPPGARSALDVGCGNGLLAFDLRRIVPDVTGIDTDAAVLHEAGQHDDTITWIHGDVLTHEFGRQFDVVASVATMRHLPDLAAGLERLAELTVDGGVLVIVGLARASRLIDVLLHLGGAVQHRWMVARHGYWEHSAPTVWPPPHDYATVRRTAERVLPGVQWRQLLMWRYVLTWRKPEPTSGQGAGSAG